MVEFIPLDESHVPLIRKWLSRGEARRWYGGEVPETEDQVRQHYLVEKCEGGTHCFIIQLDGEPVGHLQYYRASDYPEWCTTVSASRGDYGMDLFLGRDDLLGRGIGTQVIKAALKHLVFRQDDAKRCVMGPSPQNHRAIRCYEKCGFRHVRTVTDETGESEYVMFAERPDGWRAS